MNDRTYETFGMAGTSFYRALDCFCTLVPVGVPGMVVFATTNRDLGPFVELDACGGAIAARVADVLTRHGGVWDDIEVVVAGWTDDDGCPRKLTLRSSPMRLGAWGDAAFLAVVARAVDDVSRPVEPVTLEDVYLAARAAEGPLPPARPPVPDDVRAELDDVVARGDLVDLLSRFTVAARAAVAAPGRQVDGNVLLGAPPSYYRPSEAELVLAATGGAVRRLLGLIQGPGDVRRLVDEMLQSDVDPGRLEFVEYVYERVDVVGSGRFLYPVQSRTVIVDVLELVLGAVPGGALLLDDSSSPAERRRLLSRIRDVLGSPRGTS